MSVARSTLVLVLLCAACQEPLRTESGTFSEGAAPPLPEADPPLAQSQDERCELEWGGGGYCPDCGTCCLAPECLDPDPSSYDATEWEELCSWAATEQECDDCGGGGCEVCRLDQHHDADAGPGDDGDAGSGDGDAGSDDGDGDAGSGGDEPWATDDECNEWYGGDDGFCPGCDDCCASSTCSPDDDPSVDPDQECNEWYGGDEGFCPECDDCCRSEACTPDVPEDESEWTDEQCDERYRGGGFCVDCAACCWSDQCW